MLLASSQGLSKSYHPETQPQLLACEVYGESTTGPPCHERTQWARIPLRCHLAMPDRASSGTCITLRSHGPKRSALNDAPQETSSHVWSHSGYPSRHDFPK